MKALILVGGFGTRLRPLTLSVPKPIVPFANKEMVVHQIQALVEAGVSEVILAVNYRPEIMKSYLKPWEEKLNVKVSYSQEKEPMGTAGPLALVREKLDSDEPFFVLNSDVTCDYPLKEMVNFHKKSKAEGTILVTKVSDPTKYGVVVANDEGKIERFVEKPKEYVGNKINAGIYIFSRGILDRIPLKPTSIEKEVFPQMANDGCLYRMVLEGYWMDVGQPKDFITGSGLYLHNLLKTEPELLSKESYVSRSGSSVLVHESAKIGENCLFGPNVTIGPNVEIQDGVRLKHAVIMEGCVIQSNAYIADSIIGWRCSVGRWTRIENCSVFGEDVQILDELW
eukprot:CAMPEP_0201522166 /NCGR_PEP_ID=MMETSP0161_2-20130828/16494_1 /ASSEMBLY_ACC=CAM_ASM_000251 /TAXON_ID=180227 /ORGANISM="Neoparamoeba aestuarina, Strain SoJaBio B1-5/56/2" /LENGTH=338 /DNA_ID=CAMNT_0047920935 /DNA_START=42 /DNA_END=1055 /DNA_ORIENTATION=-